MSSSAASTSVIASAVPSPTPTSLIELDETIPAHNVNSVVAFIIGLSIVLAASLLNAAGLNLTKLDHVRTSAIPKAERRRDWLRPLWLLGMMLYILSQLFGSTLALEYMRAEYVAPLGSTSLVFNFLFARFLVGTPVTSTDIYGTITVVFGVIGIVAFGSINSGLVAETDVAHLTYLWRRSGWLGFFFLMSFALLALLHFTSSLDAILAARSEITAEPVDRRKAVAAIKGDGWFAKVRRAWGTANVWVMETLEAWTAAKDDKLIAWTLGIGWACCGGGLAGGTLVFAKAMVKLISGSLSHQNPGNQFGHASSIFTIILVVCTAVMQIVCLNRGLKVYDSTLVVPVFYGVYTASGFVNSLIFNDEVDSYRSWTLFLIFVSILVLIAGVVLLTHKKPEGSASASTSSAVPMRTRRRGLGKVHDGDEDGEDAALRVAEEGEAGESEELWQVGEASDEEDDNVPARPSSMKHTVPGEEGRGLIDEPAEDEGESHGLRGRRSTSSDATLGETPRTAAYKDAEADAEEFGEWKGPQTTT